MTTGGNWATVLSDLGTTRLQESWPREIQHLGSALGRTCQFGPEIIKRSDAAVGFEVIPPRWVVERTFAWMTRWRRLVRDYEERIDCSEAMIHVALGSVLLRRIAHE